MEAKIAEQLKAMSEIDMRGDRFYCVLTNDVLKLFNSTEEADEHFQTEDDDFRIPAVQTLSMFRFSKHGILEQSASDYKFTILF